MSPVLLGVPIEIGRAAARGAARRELAKAIYHRDDPSLLERAVAAVLRWLGSALDRAAQVSPGGAWGLVGVVVLGIVLTVGVRARTGPLARASRVPDPLFTGGPRSAAEHRREADRLAAAGAWSAAVRERLRAIVRELEQRGVLEPAAGRTADELAADAAAALPHLGADLQAAARTFDELWYGGRPATEAADRVLREVDERVRGVPVGARGARGGRGGS